VAVHGDPVGVVDGQVGPRHHGASLGIIERTMGSPAAKNRRWSWHGELFTELGKTENSPGSVVLCGGSVASEGQNGGTHRFVVFFRVEVRRGVLGRG
jgi:hypothetical protein